MRRTRLKGNILGQHNGIIHYTIGQRKGLDISLKELNNSMSVMAKIRYSAKPEKATLIPLEDGNIKVVFDVPQRAITPGQSAVFYNDDIVVGGGTIF